MKSNKIDSYVLGIEEELSSILSTEISKSIDKEIFKSLGIDLDKKDRRIKSINKIFKL